MKPSARDPNLYYSFEACDGKIQDEPFPLQHGKGNRKTKGKGKAKGKGKGKGKAKGQGRRVGS